MIEQSKLRNITAVIIVISLVFGLLSFWKIRYQFYFWEILIDLKSLSLLGMIAFSVDRREIVVDPSQFSFLSFNWKKNLLWFFVPFFLYVVVIGVGIAVGTITINTMDNVATLILATIFDIPAIYVFSATSILIEELVFRGLILRSYRQSSGINGSILITGLLWTVYMISEIVGVEVFDIAESAVLALFVLANGILLAALSLSREEVWSGYSLRIGLITLTPIILTSRVNESDSFFTTDSLLFIAEGVFLSILAIFLTVILIVLFRKKSPVSSN